MAQVIHKQDGFMLIKEQGNGHILGHAVRPGDKSDGDIVRYFSKTFMLNAKHFEPGDWIITSDAHGWNYLVIDKLTYEGLKYVAN